MPRHPLPRRYRSPVRKAQAERTRERILDAARPVFVTRGYEATTIEGIAASAGVAPQTVYASFQSKRGILAALLDRERFGDSYHELVRRARSSSDPIARLSLAAGIARQVHDSERALMELVRGAGAVSPELRQIESANETARREGQAGMISFLTEAGALRKELDVETARDILWALTGRDMYRMLVILRGWPPDKYESWIAATLIGTLLTKPSDC